MNNANECLFTSSSVGVGTKRAEVMGVLTGAFVISISNEISGPFLGSVDKVPFSNTRKGEETTAALTSLKFPFLQQQESQ